jgi:hypothetical protein
MWAGYMYVALMMYKNVIQDFRVLKFSPFVRSNVISRTELDET